MKIKSYSLSGPLPGVTKQHSILASCGAYSRPLVYLQRPKWIVDDAQWLRICQGVSVTLPDGFEVTEPPIACAFP